MTNSSGTWRRTFRLLWWCW